MRSPVTSQVRGAARGRRSTWLTPVAAAFLVLPLGACEGLLDVDLPGSLTEEALKDPVLSETLVTSAVADFECGLVDSWYIGQWFEEWQNTSTGRPNALSQFRSQLVGVYADPCSSGTGPIWTTIQTPRAAAARAVEFIRSFTYTPANLPDTTFLIAKARLYEGYSIQLLAEQFCAVTFNGGPLITRLAAYDSAEAKFTEAINKFLTVTGARAAEVTSATNGLLHAARVGRARARLYQWQYGGQTAALAADVVADASLVTATGFQLNATYDDNPGRRRNRIRDGQTGRNFMPTRDHINLRLDTTTGLPFQGTTGGTLDPRMRVTIASPTAIPPDVDGRGVFPMRRQTKQPNRSSPMAFSSWREARLMIGEVDPAQTLAVINQLRTVTTGLAATINTTGTNAGYSAWPLPQISAATWAGLTLAQQRQTLWEERRRETYLQGTHPGDKIRWAYPAWGTQDEYGASTRDVLAIDDPLTPEVPELAPGCLPIPYLEKTSNLNLIAIAP